ncbi:MAG: serpin family protein [Chloroflexota bacterium]
MNKLYSHSQPKFRSVAATFLALFLLICHPYPTYGQETNEPNIQSELVAGNSEFAFDLYHTIRESDENLFYSPYSISTALAMTYVGARGNTEQQMANILHYNLSQEQLHPAFKNLSADLTQQISSTEPVSFTLNVANSLWPQAGYPFRAAFLDTVAENYGSGIQEVDYVDDAKREEARVAINEWSSEHTRGKIPEPVAASVLTDLTRLVLANATYFRAEWVEHFDETDPRQFVRLDGSTVVAPMMSAQRYFDYVDGEGYQALALPYKGDRSQMIVLLPDPGQFSTIETELNPAFLSQVMEQFASKEMYLITPKFTYKTKLDLKATLQTMGMTDAFSEERADFSSMSDEDEKLHISALGHDAFISVDEKGTEAAAVTAVTIGGTSAPNFCVALDRPFIFLIHDMVTDSILFVGRVLNPVTDNDAEEMSVTAGGFDDCFTDVSQMTESTSISDNTTYVFLPVVNQ